MAYKKYIPYKKTPEALSKRLERFYSYEKSLSLFIAIATRATACIATAITHVNFSKRAIIARTVILTFRNATTDTRVDFLIFFVHHKKILLFDRNSMRKYRKIIDIFKKIL
jgi:hypothetical protein